MPRADARLCLAVVLAAPLLAASATAEDPRYLRLDARGAPTSDHARWQCTRDTATGLTWEVKTTDGGLRDRRWTYTPYDGNPDTNGGYPGYRDTTSGRCIRERMRGRSCNTEAYVEAVNAQGLCGHRDWRLPTYTELAAVAPETSSAARGATPLGLPDTEEGWYWTAVAKVGVTSFSRVVLLPPRARPQFYDGSYLVMLVRDR
ncbi:MAG TPA: DUF1566 domain-containing protein [Gammaproteobacteria bacterium]|nr:DUF1566 domain-containing protein [Gammaproteobacteria bacterium]